MIEIKRNKNAFLVLAFNLLLSYIKIRKMFVIIGHVDDKGLQCVERMIDKIEKIILSELVKEFKKINRFLCKGEKERIYG